ncbi:hypothetical protein BS78_05G265100 [Paspalum vaginatum]|nr:hypothetical protein BS78_05G265100 [Paspalum vaginatum]
MSAIELAKIGITLKANKRTELIHMGVKKKGPIFGELFLAPVTLTRVCASCLVNMAALELSSTLHFSSDRAEHEQSAVCSYLLLFTMFVDRKEDVHELRTKGLLQGGSGLTDSEALYFFTSLQSLRLGGRYVQIMEDIEQYRTSRRMRTIIHTVYYNNKKTIITVFSVVAGVISILGTLKSLQGRH